jgi:hypothetical protein
LVRKIFLATNAMVPVCGASVRCDVGKFCAVEK